MMKRFLVVPMGKPCIHMPYLTDEPNFAEKEQKIFRLDIINGVLTLELFNYEIWSTIEGKNNDQ